MPRFPLIGVTLSADADPELHDKAYRMMRAYPEAITAAGGLPVVLPYLHTPAAIAALVDRLDGLLFTGGNDLDPILYGQSWHPSATPISPARQTFELALLQAAELAGKPVLGICLGCQLLNVHRGGSLVQFLPDRPGLLEHRSFEDATPPHPVTLEPGSVLAKTIGPEHLRVNTAHKQAIDRPGRGLRVVARAEDGVIEGVEDPALPFFLGVQWHPERMPDQPEQRQLFRGLVRASMAE